MKGMGKMYIELLKKAEEARKNAHAGYSGFYVGAALLTTSGKIYTGCNIENLSYSLTMCAERTAFFKAVSEGESSFKAVAVVGAVKDADCMAEQCFPCGACLQVMNEFCGRDFEVVLSENCTEKVYRLDELMPYAFSSEF